MQRFVRECRVTAETRVLDIGGTPDNWQLIPVAPRLVLLNMPRARAAISTSITSRSACSAGTHDSRTVLEITESWIACREIRNPKSWKLRCFEDSVHWG